MLRSNDVTGSTVIVKTNIMQTSTITSELILYILVSDASGCDFFLSAVATRGLNRSKFVTIHAQVKSMLIVAPFLSMS